MRTPFPKLQPQSPNWQRSGRSRERGSNQDYDLDSATLRETFGHFPSGVAALCSDRNGVSQGIIASTFTVGVSLDPPLVMFAVQNSSRTWPLIRDGERIGVSILAADQAQVRRQIASKSGNRFADVSVTTTPSGAVFLDGAGLWLDCSIESETPAGTTQWCC
ncbi:flavin reductase family protein [Arthrobacter sp. ISL-30]|uniref:flavin reductase family protein n=1 Tax=Arthrobacter sp. ISL-30 TaxID=2819109 RepID=UPI002035C2F6|nr:flavin reductase family protein [Arthrobacter sp. ISL-30]